MKHCFAGELTSLAAGELGVRQHPGEHD